MDLEHTWDVIELLADILVEGLQRTSADADRLRPSRGAARYALLGKWRRPHFFFATIRQAIPATLGISQVPPKDVSFAMKRPIVLLSLLLAASGMTAAAAGSPPLVDATARTAIMSAFKPEWLELRAALHEPQQYVIGRTTFLTGTIENKPVLLFLSGISMVNAALTSQLAVDRFNVSRIVFSGIAGGVDPNLSIGDVIVPNQWSEYLESAFARKTQNGYVLPPFESKKIDHFGMIFPQPVEIANPGAEPEHVEWFPVDAQLLALARNVSGTAHLASCTPEKTCLSHPPKVIVGGNGVSGQAFVDNREFREYVRSTFTAEVVDMESAAVAHVAYVNSKPFVAFRSLSDLAGADPQKNQEQIFAKLASQNSAAVVMAFIKELP